MIIFMLLQEVKQYKFSWHAKMCKKKEKEGVRKKNKIPIDKNCEWAFTQIIMRMIFVIKMMRERRQLRHLTCIIRVKISSFIGRILLKKNFFFELYFQHFEFEENKMNEIIKFLPKKCKNQSK